MMGTRSMKKDFTLKSGHWGILAPPWLPRFDLRSADRSGRWYNDYDDEDADFDGDDDDDNEDDYDDDNDHCSGHWYNVSVIHTC